MLGLKGLTVFLVLSTSSPVEHPQRSTSAFCYSAKSHSQWILCFPFVATKRLFSTLRSPTGKWLSSPPASPEGTHGFATKSRPPTGSAADQVSRSALPDKSHGELPTNPTADAFVRGELIRQKRCVVWRFIVTIQEGRAHDAWWALRWAVLCRNPCCKRFFSPGCQETQTRFWCAFQAQ